MTTTDDVETTAESSEPPRVASTRLRHRLYYGETSYDFFGKRWWGIGISLILVLISIGSFLVRQVDLGLDFVGGVAWDVPAETLTVDDTRQVLNDAGLDGEGARVQELSNENTRRLKVELEEESTSVRETVRNALAQAAGVDPNDVDVRAVSARWGDTVTEAAARALIVFLVLIVLFITIRFEFAMAFATIVAMLHDVIISVGVYSVFQFEVTPATVIAFLTILGFSIYDGIVVFDKVRENRVRYRAWRLGEPDIDNISMNQVLMRSLNTGIAAVLPVVALLVVGDGILGAASLREFALALLIGMITGAYSSIFIATPLLAMLKTRRSWSPRRNVPHATGADLRALVLGHAPVSKRQSARRTVEEAALAQAPASSTATSAAPASVLQHPPRPRKKRRR